ncbi:hypothetical protein MOB84_09485, partial [Bacillus inaquosorum]|nr:hypothetical protein [Bacillus inaquosorum]
GACEQAFNINGEAAVRLPLYYFVNSI